MTDRPALTRPTYHCWLAPEGRPDAPDDELDYHRVVVHGTDQLRAELEGRKLGLPDGNKAAMHLTALWLWAALTRTGAITIPFPKFRDSLVAFDPADRDSGEPVDPTDPSTS